MPSTWSWVSKQSPNSFSSTSTAFSMGSLAAEVVEELFAEDDEGENPELATARALVERQYAAKLAAGKRDQVAAALARRGFSHAVIREVLSGDE